MSITIVRACTRDSAGGSPTAVLSDGPLSSAERQAVPVSAGTSHAVFVSPSVDGSVRLRFFTSAGELPACGHGTVAALAVLAVRAGLTEYAVTLQTAGGVLAGQAVVGADGVRASFEVGPVALEAASPPEAAAVHAALGLATTGPPGAGPATDAADAIAGAGASGVTPGDDGTRVVRAVPGGAGGRPRLLVPVRSRATLAALAPDMDALQAACDGHGLLGCYVWAPGDRLAARMFAPSIGVPEDIANANSTACLAAHLAATGGAREIAVDMGDSLGAPATVTAAAVPHARAGPRTRAGGTVRWDS